VGLENIFNGVREFGRKAVVSGMIVGAGILSYGCGKETGPGPDPSFEEFSQQETVEMSYINFNAHWNNGDPAFVNVYLYKAYSDESLISGNTLLNGDFYSSIPLSTDPLYEIFIKDIRTGQCLNSVLVSFKSNIPWKRVGQREVDEKINLGPKNPMRNLQGCRP